MPGTPAGGKRAAATNIKKYGKDFYRNIGRIGGANGHTGGFAYKDNGRKFGAIGGRRSRRGYKLTEKRDDVYVYENKETGEIEEVLV